MRYFDVVLGLEHFKKKHVTYWNIADVVITITSADVIALPKVKNRA